MLRASSILFAVVLATPVAAAPIFDIGVFGRVVLTSATFVGTGDDASGELVYDWVHDDTILIGGLPAPLGTNIDMSYVPDFRDGPFDLSNLRVQSLTAVGGTSGPGELASAGGYINWAMGAASHLPVIDLTFEYFLSTTISTEQEGAAFSYARSSATVDFWGGGSFDTGWTAFSPGTTTRVEYVEVGAALRGGAVGTKSDQAAGTWHYRMSGGEVISLSIEQYVQGASAGAEHVPPVPLPAGGVLLASAFVALLAARRKPS